MPQDLINKITDPAYYWRFDPDEDWTSGGAIYMVPFDYQYKYIYLAITTYDFYAVDSDSDFDLTYWPVSHTTDNEAIVLSSYNNNSMWRLYSPWEKKWNYDENLGLSSFVSSSYLKKNCSNGFDENKMTYIKTPVNPGLFIILYGRGDHDGDYFDWIKLEPLDESQYNIVQSPIDWRI